MNFPYQDISLSLIQISKVSILPTSIKHTFNLPMIQIFLFLLYRLLLCSHYIHIHPTPTALSSLLYTATFHWASWNSCLTKHQSDSTHHLHLQIMFLSPYSKTVVLKSRRFCPPGDIWQHLETHGRQGVLLQTYNR